ncbi:hypothetical protein FACS189459_6120 [Bacilli bacterium]|nr:hypothetical protein FACS189459_6120 [Bacilli bacterium]GHU52013.1 hypothetical protein FACS189496_1410 [Bacilli bacterium]
MKNVNGIIDISGVFSICSNNNAQNDAIGVYFKEPASGDIHISSIISIVAKCNATIVDCYSTLSGQIDISGVFCMHAGTKTFSINNIGTISDATFTSIPTFYSNKIDSVIDQTGSSKNIKEK